MPPYFRSHPPEARLPSSLAGLSPKHKHYDSPHSAAKPAPVRQQQSPITFVAASGKQIPLKSLTSLPSDGMYSPVECDGFEEQQDDRFEDLPSLATLVREEIQWRRKVAESKLDKGLHEGHHCGGYRPGKNLRQSPSIRYVSVGSEISKMVGLPARVLASTAETFQALQAQTAYGDWASQAVSGYRP